MKHLIVLVLVFTMGSAVSAQTTDSLEAKIARLLELSGAEAQFLTAVDNMILMQRQQVDASTVSPAFWDEFSKEIHEEGWQLILPDLTAVYRNNLTEAEIDHQIAYLSDPLSQQIVAKQSTLMQQSMAAGQQWGMKMGARVAQRLQEALEKD
ncbi:hypothetical protein LEM8419_01362 [Neolewinella maritima]|uniref:DUF2059 domain-containing protein n=1 Tax=Neolewinella maritima TaxID=1383882 RepID=A0ABM9B0A5_9BACT|nr:DUF2059 domain-containing protein [Neolewinella maritima]CAH1000214.1 hypothetical protein LEM8419_01362 [Neolewinella maritima]